MAGRTLADVEPTVAPEPALEPDSPEPEEERRRLPGLSPSRASDYQQCPLLFRLRVIDRLPEPPSPAALRGTLVHAVLERLFDRPAGQRTPDAAADLLAPVWAELVAADPRATEVLDETGEDGWFAAARPLLETYFTLEDPNRLEPAERELAVRVVTDDGWEMRGIVDRLDVAPNGARAGGRLQDRAARRARASSPARCSRCGSTPCCCPGCGAGCRTCSSWCTWATACCCATSPTSASSRCSSAG